MYPLWLWREYQRGILRVNVRAPDIECIRSGFKEMGMSDYQINIYTPRTLLCLDKIQGSKGYIHSAFFRAIADKITIKSKHKRITYIRLLEESKLIKRTRKYVKGVKPKKTQVIQTCINQNIEICEEDMNRINKAINAISEPKLNKTLDWLNQSIEHSAVEGVYFALEEIPQGWYDIPHTDIISVCLYKKLQNKLSHLYFRGIKSSEDRLEKQLLTQNILALEEGLKNPKYRATKEYKELVRGYNKFSKEYLLFIRNIIDGLAKDCSKNNVKVACEGNRIWTDNIAELRQILAAHLGSHLKNLTQHSIIF